MILKGESTGVVVRSRVLGRGPSIDVAVRAFAGCDRPFVLESSGSDGVAGRYSIFGCDPIDSFESDDDDWLIRFSRRISVCPESSSEADSPFSGGWVGFISYEAGAAIEGVGGRKPRYLELPRVSMGLYDCAAVYDYFRRTWKILACDIPGRPSPISIGRRLARLETLLEGSRSVDPIAGPLADEPRPDVSRSEFAERFGRAKAYISAGDIYQVNLTQRYSTRCCHDPLEIFLRMRRVNPAAYSAFLPYDRATILSASPELFLSVRRGKVVTRPIKGTRPRVGDATLDEVRRGELLLSEKDHAELYMIVDLLRNDLGRVSRFGTVRVERTADIESHPTVFHLVSTLSARLREDVTIGEVLRATLPGGSITGCPKIRAMQIIDELEPTERGVYCGNIGYIGVDGSMMFNIAIRTMVHQGSELHLFGGGAIVSDSQPDDEYDEALAKIAGLSRTLTGTGPTTSTEIRLGE
jgi:para-aminobenzoate synthetase component I